jgi:hypothetical protein
MGTGEPAATYENLLPLVESINSADGKTFEYVFRCPETGFKAVGTATLADAEPPGGRKPSLREGMKDQMGLGAVRDSLERGVPGGTLAADAAEMAMFWKRDRKRKRREIATGKQRLEQTQEQLLVDAFNTVADRFRWDADAGRWVKA